MATAGADRRKFAYIDALRGYAVLMVITAHTGGLFGQLPYPVKKLTNFGWYGVQLFFLVSCITLMISWRREETKGPVSVSKFWQKRFFRIAPMYYFAGLSYFIFFPPKAGFDFEQMITSALFINAWNPLWIPTVPDRWLVVPGGWSIGVEFTFYALFPVFVLIARSPWRLTGLLLLTIAGAALLNPIVDGYLQGRIGPVPATNFVYFSFLNQMHVFVLGGLLYYGIEGLRSRPDSVASRLLRHWNWPVIGACLVAGVVVANLRLPQWASLHSPLPPGMLLATLILMALAATLALNEACLAVNGFACLFGRVSFSAYLLHFAVLSTLPALAPDVFDLQAEGWHALTVFGLLWIAAVPLTLGLSMLTFAAVETPMIQLGRVLSSASWPQRQRPPMAASAD